MKKLLKPVTAAKGDSPIWFKLTQDAIIQGSIWGDNIWFRYILETYPLDEALNINSLEGSKVIDGALYYADTTEIEIDLNGETISIDEVLDKYEPEDLGSLIEENPDPSKAKAITSVDVNLNIIDVNSVARLLLREHDLTQVAVDAEDLGLISLD